MAVRRGVADGPGVAGAVHQTLGDRVQAGPSLRGGRTERLAELVSGALVPRARSTVVIYLSTNRRRRLVHLARRSTAAIREGRRAKILLAAAGEANASIAGRVGCHVATVRRARRVSRAGHESPVRDRPRPGRPLLYDLDVWLLVVATATSQPPETYSQWTHQLIAQHLYTTRGIGISASQVEQILAEADLKPYRVRGWLNRPDDPDLCTRARQICDLYQNIPDGMVLLSLDEKTGIQAKSRKHPTRPARPGRPAVASSNTYATAPCG